MLVFSSDTSDMSWTDRSVQPAVQYQFSVEARNAGGATNSSWAVVTVPEATPPLLPAITNVTALSSESIYVAWADLGNSTIDQYRVLIHSESFELGSEWPASATNTSLIITGLRPYTWYLVHLAACIEGVPNGCGTNPQYERVRTWEAAPADQSAPDLRSTGATSVTVSWQPPTSPNGVILQFRIVRRRESQEPVLISVVNGSVYTFINDGIDLKPFTVYQYRITAVNSHGETTSQWTDVRTMEDAPHGLSAPVVSTAGSVSFLVFWQPPSQPNGQIYKYAIEYRADGRLNTLYVSASTHNASVSGVESYTKHSVRVRAVNSAGSTTSRWTDFITGPGSPSGLSPVSVELVTGGRSVILSWSPPTQPNGRILNYAVYTAASGNVPVYDGTSLHFEMIGLEPASNYSVQLKTCTVAGCTRSPWQHFMTSQAPPANQQAPSVQFVNDSSVLIGWSRPSQTFGDILSYQVQRRTLSSDTTSKRRRSTAEYETIYTTTDTGPSYFTYLDNAVLPFTR